MTKYVHIVYVHPVELGKPNLYKVNYEQEFDTKEKAEDWIKFYNRNIPSGWENLNKAVYYGCVNDATGELV